MKEPDQLFSLLNPKTLAFACQVLADIHLYSRDSKRSQPILTVRVYGMGVHMINVLSAITL